jgi:biopolymer transport protein ExbD
MITRPLDLASKLRAPPRSLDALFFVNAVLLVFFFSLFGSPFVLRPGLPVDFQLPEVVGANADAQPATHYITVMSAGQIFAGDGLRTQPELRLWLGEQAGLWTAKHVRSGKAVPKPTLLVLASGHVAMEVITDISASARAAGFNVYVAATEPGTATRSLATP